MFGGEIGGEFYDSMYIFNLEKRNIDTINYNGYVSERAFHK